MRLLDPAPPPPFAELLEAALGEPVRRELGAEIASALCRVAHAGDERLEHLVVKPRGRDHHALLVEPPRAGGQASRLARADIGVVGAADGEADAASA